MNFMPYFDAIRPIMPQNNQNRTVPPKKKRRKWKLLALLVFLFVIAGSGYYLVAKTNQIFKGPGNIFSRVAHLIVSSDKPLIGEEEGSINVLLMGVGGNGHDGAYLTDTMIVANINTQTHEIVLTSIPRDFALNLPTLGYNKINAAYAYAYRDNPDTAGLAAIAAAEKVTGFTIPYYAVIDFKGFVKAVNDVGGVDVVVDNTFTDSSFPNDYPNDTKGYLAPVTFTKGPQHMAGQRALIFARSRHSDNAQEGSDFARSERQKKILVALKNKILSLNLGKLATLNNLLTDFTQNFRTNLEPFELKRLADIAQKINSDNIYSFSLEPQGNLICSALVDPQTGKRVPEAPAPAATTVPAANPTAKNPINNPANQTSAGTPMPPAAPEIIRMYVVQPCEGKTLADINAFILQSPAIAKLKKEGTVVEIQNSTFQPSVLKPYQKLSDLGLNARFKVFGGKVPYTQTILYDNSRGTKPHTLDYLKTNYKFTISDVGYPTSAADFVIVLGRDAL